MRLLAASMLAVVSLDALVLQGGPRPCVPSHARLRAPWPLAQADAEPPAWYADEPAAGDAAAAEEVAAEPAPAPATEADDPPILSYISDMYSSTGAEEQPDSTGTPPPADAGEEEEESSAETLLGLEDLQGTKWKVLVSPRPEGWLGGDDFISEFTLLADGGVVWGGAGGGTGVGGRWTLRDETLEVIRTTPLALVTGRDYYMSSARAELTGKLQFAMRGVVRSCAPPAPRSRPPTRPRE